MQPSILKTIFVPRSPTPNPARLIGATDVPLRVVLSTILNGGATAIAFAFSVNDLTPTVSSESFASDAIMILAPKQTLYAVAIGGTAAVSIAASEAYPVL